MEQLAAGLYWACAVPLKARMADDRINIFPNIANLQNVRKPPEVVLSKNHQCGKLFSTKGSIFCYFSNYASVGMTVFGSTSLSRLITFERLLKKAI
jgi:hypothetical protein